MKIEKVKMPSYNTKSEWKDFVATLKRLKVGESFLIKLESNHRMAISIVQDFLNIRFITRKDGNKHRVGRIE